MASSMFQSVFGEFFEPIRVETDVPQGLSEKLVEKWIDVWLQQTFSPLSGC